MALEAVVFSQDHPLTSYNLRDQLNFYNFGSYDFPNNYPNPLESVIHNVNSNELKDDDNNNNNEQQFVNNSDNSSPEGHCNCTGEQYLSGKTETPDPPPPTDGSEGRRKRRRRSCKNKEEVEQQRMTHITVERNRRKQMNHYLALIRSLMPPSHAQRGDQASIVGGAINYVKELEQLLQSLEAHKRTKHDHHDHPQNQPHPSEGVGNNMSINDYFTAGSFPNQQYYPNGSSQQQGSGSNSVSSNAMMNNSVEGEDQVQVTMVETHANVKILAKKQPKQLLRLVAGFQGLRLSVLHLNFTSLHNSFLLYSFSLKVEEGCEVNTVEDITAAANHILGQVQVEAAIFL